MVGLGDWGSSPAQKSFLMMPSLLGSRIVQIMLCDVCTLKKVAIEWSIPGKLAFLVDGDFDNRVLRPLFWPLMILTGRLLLSCNEHLLAKW